MLPLLANGINIPFVFAIGLAVVIPLIVFQMFVEAAVLSRFWQLPARDLRSFTLRANIYSMVAGIPTKLVNGAFYSLLLTNDLSQFYSRYTPVVIGGTLVYFVVTVLVETWAGRKWAQEEGFDLSRQRLWKGLLVANVLTYTLLAPLHYFVTRPSSDIRGCAPNARWAQNAATRIAFLDPDTRHLNVKSIGNDDTKTVVPIPMQAYLVSSDLNVCVYSDNNGALCLWRNDPPLNKIVVSGEERHSMAELAFSSSGNKVALLARDGSRVDVFDVQQEHTVSHNLDSSAKFNRVAWTTSENQFLLRGRTNNQSITVTISPAGLQLDKVGDSPPALLTCYGFGRGPVRWNGWWDDCNERSIVATRGLSSRVRVSVKTREGKEPALKISATSGLLQFGLLQFSEAAFLDDCNEAIFVSARSIYLLDVDQRRMGRIAAGIKAVPLTSRFAGGFAN